MIASSTAAAGGLSAGLGIVWIVVLFGIMYFMMIRPQKKEQKRTQTMLNSMEVGDRKRRYRFTGNCRSHV